MVLKLVQISEVSLTIQSQGGLSQVTSENAKYIVC